MLSYFGELRHRLVAHNVVVTAAGVAFYGLLALVPTLVALVTVYGLVANPADIEQQVNDIAGNLDDDTRGFLENQLRAIVGAAEAEAELNGERGGDSSSDSFARWTTLVGGIALALWSSSGAVQKLIRTVAIAYEVEEYRPGWKLRLMAYGFTAGAIVGVALMILVIAIAPNVLSRVDLGGAAATAITVLQYPTLAVLFAGALTVLYRYGPDRRPRTPWLNPGAALATLLFLLFAIAFSVYSASVGSLPASYGLLGSIAALMIFLQLTTIAVVIGAETNSIVEIHRAERLAEAEPDASGEQDDTNPPANLSLGKALAGLAALFVLGRGAGR